MLGDFHSAPVPVRLSFRYANGTVVSYLARAVACDDSSLRVLSAEGFEKGVRLNVLAPFLQGIVPCRVAAASRSREQATYFVLDLKFLKKPDRVIESHKAVAVEESGLVPEDVARISREFAAQLEQHQDRRIFQVLQQAPADRHLVLLAVLAAAAALLLQDKGLLDLHHLSEGLKLKGRT